MTVKQPGVAIDHLEISPLIFSQFARFQPPRYRAEDQSQWGSQFVADVGEELGLELVQFARRLQKPGDLATSGSAMTRPPRFTAWRISPIFAGPVIPIEAPLPYSPILTLLVNGVADGSLGSGRCLSR